jgi:hypothetical protein
VSVDLDDDEDIVEFENDTLESGPSELDHDPMDDPQTCLGCTCPCSKKAVRKVCRLFLSSCWRFACGGACALEADGQPALAPGSQG